MKVKILVEFEVTTDLDEEEHGELTENRAKSAASEAAYQHLCFTHNIGFASIESVDVHVDGFGECTVKIGEEHE
jgi:hypothetical protein